MSFNYELFRVVVAPEFASKTDAEIDLFANEALCEVNCNKSRWGCRYDRAWALITAHMMKLSEISKNGSSGGGGPLKKVKVGQLEREYDTASSTEAKNGSYNLTNYGLEYIRLRKKNLSSPIFVPPGC